MNRDGQHGARTHTLTDARTQITDWDKERIFDDTLWFLSIISIVIVLHTHLLMNKLMSKEAINRCISIDRVWQNGNKFIHFIHGRHLRKRNENLIPLNGMRIYGIPYTVYDVTEYKYILQRIIKPIKFLLTTVVMTNLRGLSSVFVHAVISFGIYEWMCVRVVFFRLFLV